MALFLNTSTWLERLYLVSFWEWFIIGLCVLFSSVFSASETALTSLNYVKVKQLIESNPQQFGRFKFWLDHPNHVLTTILIGNNLANILASSLATAIAQRIFKQQGIAIAVGVMTLVILISGEIVPKTYAKHNAQKVSRLILPILTFCYWMFYPATLVLVRFSGWFVRLFGGEISSEGPFVTKEEIEYIIDLGSREGVLDAEKEKLLQSILEFDEITTREVMVPRVKVSMLPVDILPEELLSFAIDSIHSRIPVYEGSSDNVIGVLYVRDLFRLYATSTDKSEFVDLKKILRSCYFVPSTMKISSLLKEFQKRKSHLAIVVDEFGGTMGLVTMEDVIEELVGEIHDEYDLDEKQEIVKIEEQLYRMNAIVGLRDLEELLDVEFPEDGDYETLGGFLTDHEGAVPQAGSLIEWKDFSFTILEANEKHICQVEVKIHDDAKSDEEESPSSTDSLESI